MGNIIELRRRIIMGGIAPEPSLIPPGYEQISYITSDGNQSLRTTYVPVMGDEFHIVLLQGGFASNGHNSGWYCKFFSSATYYVTPNCSPTTWYDIDIDSTGILTTNNQTFTCSTQAELDGTAKTLWIAERKNGTARYIGNIAEFTITNNGQYKMNLIPCRRLSDQKVGMYDTVSKTFLTSALSDFIAGV